MPLKHLERIAPQRAWALWHISEGEPTLQSQLEEKCPEDFVHETKRLEWLAGRLLLKTLVQDVGLTYRGTAKDRYGKPLLEGSSIHISLSHSYPWVAAQIDNRFPAGIDIEQPRAKLRVVAHRVFSPREVADAGDDLTKLCIYWSAKEALYKYHGKRELLFSDHLAVDAFSLSTSGSIHGSIEADGVKSFVPLAYRVAEDYVVVFTCPA